MATDWRLSDYAAPVDDMCCCSLQVPVVISNNDEVLQLLLPGHLVHISSWLTLGFDITLSFDILG